MYCLLLIAGCFSPEAQLNGDLSGVRMWDRVLPKVCVDYPNPLMCPPLLLACIARM